jgi:myo-inositol-1-phosphate synthase
MECRIFDDVPMNLELRLSVENSPNSSECIIDCIRIIRLSLDIKIGGILIGPSTFYFKHPIRQYDDNIACRIVEDFINSNGTNKV